MSLFRPKLDAKEQRSYDDYCRMFDAQSAADLIREFRKAAARKSKKKKVNAIKQNT